MTSDELQYDASPCCGVCQIDHGTGWCLGCFRTINEIADWSRLSHAGKRHLWQQLAERASSVAGTAGTASGG